MFAIVLHCLQRHHKQWRDAFATHWGPINVVHEAAARLSGGWKELYRSKAATAATADPFVRPSPYEVDAVLAQVFFCFSFF